MPDPTPTPELVARWKAADEGARTWAPSIKEVGGVEVWSALDAAADLIARLQAENAALVAERDEARSQTDFWKAGALTEKDYADAAEADRDRVVAAVRELHHEGHWCRGIDGSRSVFYNGTRCCPTRAALDAALTKGEAQ